MRFSPLIRHSGFSLLLIASSAMAAGASDATTPIVPPAPAPVAAAPPAPNPVTREADAEAQFHVRAGEMAAGRNKPGIAASDFFAALHRRSAERRGGRERATTFRSWWARKHDKKKNNP